jgi:hypothetical protein
MEDDLHFICKWKTNLCCLEMEDDLNFRKQGIWPGLDAEDA